MSLKLHGFSFNVIIVSLNWSRQCKIEENMIVLKPIPYDHYADRLQITQNVSVTNLINFISNFEQVNKKLKQRKYYVIVTTIQDLVLILMLQTIFCKYQRLKHKPWYKTTLSLWNFEDEEEVDFV